MFHLQICHILFIQSLDDGHLDYLHLGGIMNNANMSICVQAYIANSPECILRGGNLGL